MDNKDTGLLLNKKNIELHRAMFKNFLKLHGLNVIYRAPRDSKQYDTYGELDAHYYEPEVVSCVYSGEAPTQKTCRKLGWDAELSEGATLVVVPYDLKGLQVGALFIIPSAVDSSKGRVFKVLKMEVGAIYPASIICELAPVWDSNQEKAPVKDYSKTDFNMLIEEEDEY